MKSEPSIVESPNTKAPNIIAGIAAMLIAFSVALMIFLPVKPPLNLVGFPISGAVLWLVYSLVNKTSG